MGGEFEALAAMPMTSCVFWVITLASCLAYSSALKMEVVCSYETAVDFHVLSQKIELFME
jgi:hypothetical protein